MNLNGIDIAIVILCPVIVALIGLVTSKYQDKTTARGYFLASGKMPWFIIGAAFVSTSVSSEQMVGTNGAGYAFGMRIANWEWFALSYIPLIIFFIPVYLKNHIITVPQFLERRYGPWCANVYSWVMLLAYVFIFMVPTLYGGGLAFSRLTGWNFYLILWLTVFFIAVYSLRGGLGSIMWADAFQCMLLLVGGLVLFFISLTKIPGGWFAMQEASPERFHLYRPPSDQIAPFLGLIIAHLCGASLFYQAANQVMVQRVLGARSTWDGILGIIFAGLINRIRPLVTCFLGFVVFHWINVMHKAPPLENPDNAFPFALVNFAPAWGLRGIIVAGFMAAVMSTIGALSNSTATIYSMDFYKKVIRPNASDRELVAVGRVAALVALCMAASTAPMVRYFGGIFIYFQKSVTFVAIPFITVMLLGIFWKRANYHAALFAVTIGMFISLGFGYGAPLLGIKLHWIYLGFISQMIILFGMIIISLLTPAPKAESCKPYLWNPSLLLHLQDDKKRSWYKSLILWFAILYLIIGVTYWYFW